MSLPEEGRGPAGMAPVFFPLNFPEVSILYSILYERELCLPSREEVMDEIERKELYPTTRHIVPDAMDMVDDVRQNMREYLVAFAGEMSVQELEARVKKTIERLNGG